MKQHLNLGSTPCDEDCAQVGQPDYQARMRVETARYIAQLERQFPKRPDGCRFAVKGFVHDFGNYHEVVVLYDDSVEAEVEFAFGVEADLPARWE